MDCPLDPSQSLDHSSLTDPSLTLCLDMLAATANVDVETDALIQETLRHEFKGCSVLTVAHRLATVVFYDRVLVMDQGRIIEYDAPLRLLERPDGLFYSMCERTGDLERLLAMAKGAAAQQEGNGAGTAYEKRGPSLGDGE